MRHLNALILLICLLIPCIKGSSPGEVYIDRPSIRVGESVNITCRMNLKMFKGLNSDALRLVNSTGHRVPQADITILNETSIVYHLRNATAQYQYYTCRTSEYVINAVNLAVGYPPGNVTDFHCQGYDFRYMVCSFTKPNNTMPTKFTMNYIAQSSYRVSYKVKNGTRIYRTVYSQNYVQPCTLEQHDNKLVCNMTSENNNYRQGHDTFNFMLMGENALGNNTQSFRINHYENVVPSKPQFQVLNITTFSAVLKWQMIMYSFYNGNNRGCKKGFDYEVYLRPANFNWLDYTSNTKLSHNASIFKVELQKLPYAYYEYEISLRLRVSWYTRTQVPCFNNIETTWSEPYNQTFRTTARAPDAAPAIDEGSFYIDPTETQLRLYWQQLPIYGQNAPDFRYEIVRVLRNGTVFNHRSKTDKPIVGTSVYFPWQREYTYEFAIKSCNAMGESVATSYIKVAALSHDLYKLSSPEWIRKIYHPLKHTYTISWYAPQNTIGLKDYTVFWCQHKKVSQNECTDTIQFEHVDKYQTNYISSAQDNDIAFNFAISANYENFSTGMHWSMCGIEDDRELIQLEPELTVKSTEIELKWNLEKICTSLPEGYNLTYCEVNASSLPATYEEATCLSNSKTTLKIDKTQRKFTLINLKPFTYYKIEMYMFSVLKVGKVSDGHLVSTKEDAPLPPRNLKHWNVTSNSAWISWLPPIQSNGIIRHYTIDSNNNKQYVYCSDEDNPCHSNETNAEIQFKLVNLTSYTNYKVFVTAHTISDSHASNDVHIFTLVGIPSHPRHMMVNDKNSSIFEWNKPDVAAGKNDYYEVAVTIWYGNEIQRRRISAVYGSEACVVDIPKCINPLNKHTLEVRAVNVAFRSNETDYELYNSLEKNVETDYYTGNDDLVCLGVAKSKQDQEKKIAEFRNEDTYVQYRSAWEKGNQYNCVANSSIPTIALLVVITSLAAMTSFYFARIKYQKMNIKIILPGELGVSADYSIKSLGGGVIATNVGAMNNSKLNSSVIDYHRSKESLFQPESHHLLSPSCNDLGFLNVGTVNQMTPCSVGSSGYEGSQRSCDYMNHEAFSALSSDAGSSVSTVVTPLEEPGYQLMQQTNTELPFDGYIQPYSLASAKQHNRLPNMLHLESNYIKPKNIVTWSAAPNNNSDYVQPHLLQQKQADACTSSVGYTTLQSLGKPSLSPAQHVPVSIATTTTTTTNKNNMHPISGYVTQRQLSVFGKQQQEQQQEQQHMS